uniref:URI1 prefoldin like chaperone n=1 Tax=Ornithorhynchus anatinus TaxID=9258 RepID=F6U6Q0_ORNAN
EMSQRTVVVFLILLEIKFYFLLSIGKRRTAHKPHSKPKTVDIFEADFTKNAKSKDSLLVEKELWARLEELERQEELLGELDREPDAVVANGEDTMFSEEEKEDKKTEMNVINREAESLTQGTFQEDFTHSKLFSGQVNGSMNGPSSYSDDDDDLGVGDNSVPTIYFSHTVEPKRVRINTGRNTTLKFSERKEEAKRKRKNSNGNGHSTPELPSIKTPADVYRVFVDVVNGEYVPRKSILKSRSRENSVCSDTSESSAADFDDRRGVLRSVSCEEATYSDTSEGILEEEEEEQENLEKNLKPFSGTLEAFSGTVIEKEPSPPSSTPQPGTLQPALPAVPQRKVEEVPPGRSEGTAKRISKFKATRLQQRS